ncbi:malto-oligosyltrehalose synthase [Labrys monachus]|nr:malto-oligosyltrehalose synthase [Labrys monachus]
MTLPLATYRLQFRNGMTFDRAVELVPYLKRLGVSHLYASPIFTATQGSTHGYDVCSHLEFDPALGGQAGFDRLSEALKRAGLGLVLDIVPNHMAASLENDWWRSVVEWGGRSPYRFHFDIDRDEKLTLPILGSSFADALARGEFAVRPDGGTGRLVFAYFDHALPLDPASYDDILRLTGEPLGAMIAACARQAEPASEHRMHRDIRALLADEPAAARLEQALAALSKEPGFLDGVHAAQSWRLLFWKDARRHLSYRRFFEITGLVGVRVEDAQVFDDVHRFILDLVRSGRVDGLRVDHVDGLADPTGYLERLRREIGPDVYLTVEKILGEGEDLPSEWPIAGTTGYEFIAALADLLVDGGRKAALDESYALAVGAVPDLEAERLQAKRLMTGRNFETEMTKLVRLAAAAAANDVISLGADSLSRAIAGLIAAFPVYRTYGTEAGMPEPDRYLLDEVARRVPIGEGNDGEALRFVLGLLKGEASGKDAGRAAEFRLRFQQLTGPVTAKAVEDTLFYRCNRFIAANEVGCDPAVAYGSLQRFHEAMVRRARLQPLGMSTTATHDTKRGEDARARLYALSEAPDAWGGAVARWRGMHAGLVRALAGGPAPEPETEWLLYQALAGVWPEGAESAGRAALQDLSARFIGYVEKSLREAKRRTNWEDVDEVYEDAVKSYAGRLVSDENRAFLVDFAAALAPFIKAGTLNSLTQTLVKMTAPGIPDIYQGAEMQDLSLVDPDNRRPVDVRELSRGLDDDASHAAGEPWLGFKQHLIARCLELRRAHPTLFEAGSYVPLEVTGPGSGHVVAFARVLGEEAAISVAPRLAFGFAGRGETPPWTEAVIDLGALGRERMLTDVLTGRRFDPASRLSVAAVLQAGPVALLTTMGSGAIPSEPS